MGFGQDCHRWTSTRHRLTKTDIAAGDRSGLVRGNPCAIAGVAYHALRLARNAIQIAHHAARDLLFRKMPWVEKEQIVFSPSHPVADGCDDVIAAALDGDGTYQQGIILLPIHVQCLCWKRAVLMPPEGFASRLCDSVSGGVWPARNEYVALLVLGKSTVVASAADTGWLKAVSEGIVRSLWADQAELDPALGTSV